MKRKIKTLCALTLAFNMVNTGFAAEIYNVSYQPEEKTVTIEGNADKAGQKVTLEILKPGISAEDIKNADISKYAQLLVHMDQTMADDDSNFLFTFKMKGNFSSDKYITRIALGEGKATENLLVYISASDFEKSFSALNSATDIAGMAAELESGKNYLGMDLKYYDKLTDDEKLALAEDILSDRESGFAKLSDFLESYRKNMAVQAVNHAGEDGVEFLEVMEEYDDILNLSTLKSYKTYSELSEDAEKQLSQVISNIKFETAEEIQNTFTDNAILVGVCTVDGYDKVYDILNENNEYLQIDFSEYDKLSDKAAVLRELAGKLYSGIEELKQEFSKAVKENKKSSGNQTSGGSSSGGGGGSSNKTNSVNLSISAPAEPQTVEKEERFKDIDSVSWAKEAINSLAERGIVSGKADREFYPTDTVKREEFVKMLVAALDLHDPTATSDFADVAESDWFCSYVASGVNNNLVSGIGDGKFGSGLPLSRQDLAVLFARTAEKLQINLSEKEAAQFADYDEISDYAKEAVTVMQKAGLINGTQTGAFEPKRSATRAETAKILYDFLKLIG